MLSQVGTTAFGDLIMWEDEEKGRVKANLPDFDPVLYPIFQIHHITYYLIDWDAINQNRKPRKHIWEWNWWVENQRTEIRRTSSVELEISWEQRSSLEPHGNESTELTSVTTPVLTATNKMSKLKTNDSLEQRRESAKQTTTLKSRETGKSRASQPRSAYLEQKPLDP